jgi:hypothetical protein
VVDVQREQEPQGIVGRLGLRGVDARAEPPVGPLPDVGERRPPGRPVRDRERPALEPSRPARRPERGLAQRVRPPWGEDDVDDYATASRASACRPSRCAGR